MAFELQNIVVSFEQQDAKARKISFIPRLTGAAGEVLLEDEYKFTITASPTTISLPVPASGVIRYNYEFPGKLRKSVGHFLLEKTDEAQNLSELIETGETEEIIVDGGGAVTNEADIWDGGSA